MTLQLDVFEGPLDLLLYLIRKNDLEISRVSLANVTDQYLSYLEKFEELDIDLAGEFLFMAAELSLIKSRALLPAEECVQHEEDGDGYDLVARLREYEKYKLAGQALNLRVCLHRDIFNRVSFFSEGGENSPEKPSKDFSALDVALFELVRAFHCVISRLPEEEFYHRVDHDAVSVMQRIEEIWTVLSKRESLLFAEIFSEQVHRMEVVVSFLAVLEMIRLGLVRAYQATAFDAIRIKRMARARLDQLKDKFDAGSYQ